MAMVVIEMGGTNVKRLAMGKRMARKVHSGPTMSTRHMIDAFRQLVADWSYDAIALEYPGAVRAGRPAVEPKNLGKGRVNIDFAAAFGCPAKIGNDAAMQALGSYEGGRILFVGLGTGPGSR